jgi:hypothetical protein
MPPCSRPNFRPDMRDADEYIELMNARTVFRLMQILHG